MRTLQRMALWVVAAGASAAQGIGSPPATPAHGSGGSTFGAVRAAALLGAVLIGAVYALFLVRKAIFGRSTKEGAVGSLSLADLRALRARGLLTDEEFERARDAVVRMTREAEASRSAAAKSRAERGPGRSTPGER